MTKRLISIILVCILCLSLCACGISEDEAVGTWSGAYEYNGNDFATAFTLEENGDYIKITFKNGSLSSSETGTWEVKGGKVILHEGGNKGVSTEYKYKGEALVNNKHEFTKE